MENLNSKYIGTNNIQFGLQDLWGKILGEEITVKRIRELYSASLSANQQSFETSVVFSVALSWIGLVGLSLDPCSPIKFVYLNHQTQT